mgnify:CR=1 FL=1
MLNVESIQNGIVIDHIPAGKGMDIYRLLELESKTQSVALLQSVKSQKYGCKDLIKIEGETLPEPDHPDRDPEWKSRKKIPSGSSTKTGKCDKM